MTIRNFLAALLGLSIASSTATAQSSSVSVAGLTAAVTVRRDARSIPYIEAANDSDLYFIQGFVTASDRLWQMDLFRRVPRGEMSEIFGQATLEEDKRWRRFGFAGIADESLKHLTPELRAALDSYARGVNAYIATLDDKTLPIEFRILQYKPKEWTVADSILVGKILADALSTTWRADLLRASTKKIPAAKLAELTDQVTPYDVVLFGKDKKKVREVATAANVSDEVLRAAVDAEDVRSNSLKRIGFYAEDLAASNNWVIAGSRTADGKALLANDPHLLPSAPGIWYLTHLATPASRVSGVTFPGVPGIVLGHNEHFAWGATNVGPDVQDLYEEQISTIDPGGVECARTPDGCKAISKRREAILVRKSLVGVDRTATPFEVDSTRNGPIVIREGGKTYSLRWTAFDPKNAEFETFFLINRARDWNDFKGALRRYGGPTQNFVYADVKGNIGWYAAGRVPIRRKGDGALPYDGSTRDGEWIGSIPFNELPNLYNPREGFIVTANQRIVGTSYKHQQMSRDAASPWRARRIYDLLKSKQKISMDDVAAVQLDSYNIPLANLSREIVRHDAASPETLALLKDWDGRMAPTSRAALVANEIRLCVSNKIADENKPVPANVIRERVLDAAIRERSALWLPKDFRDYPALLRTCDSEVAATLTKRIGADRSRWIWSTSSESRFPHPLAAAPLIGVQFATPKVGLEGSGQSPNVASYVSMRHVASPGNWDATRHVIPLGQSGDPASPHYKDQFDAWRSVSLAVFPFSKPAVDQAAKRIVVYRSN